MSLSARKSDLPEANMERPLAPPARSCVASREGSRVGGGRPYVTWIGCLLLGVTGCEQQMADQPRLEPFEASSFFENQMGSRHLVPGSVPRGGDTRDEIVATSAGFRSGLQDGELARQLPSEVTERWSNAEVLARGQERYRIYCVQCHDHVGSGNGIVPRRGFPQPPTYHSERLRAVPLGHIYRVIMTGKGKMAAHGSLMPPEDGWAIAAYVKALQLSQHADVSHLPAEIVEQIPEVTP